MPIIYWKISIMIVLVMAIFIAGYHLRTLQYEAKETKNIIKQDDKIDKVDTKYNEAVTKAGQLTDTLNQKVKVIYAQPGYSCSIPLDGVRLIQAAR